VTWKSLQITGRCQHPVEGALLLPLGSKSPGRVLVRGSSNVHLVRASVRDDHGSGACVSGGLLDALGGEGARVTYREARWLHLLRYRPWIWLQIAITLLSFTATGLGAVVTFSENARDENPVVSGTAVAVLVVMSGLALLKLIKEFRELS
jgi:hypothetical protein